MNKDVTPITIKESATEANEFFLMDKNNHWLALIRFNGEPMPERLREHANHIAKACNLHEELVQTLKKQHEATDWLLAQLLIKDPTFRPSKSPVWSTVEAAHRVITKAEEA